MIAWNKFYTLSMHTCVHEKKTITTTFKTSYILDFKPLKITSLRWVEIAAVTAVILLVRIIEKNQGKPQGTKENHWESWRQELVRKTEN